jgi:hypothetical protein
MKAFQRLYDAKPFDPDDRQDQLGEAARRLLISTALPVTSLVQDGKDMPFLLGGLLVGIVQVLQATASSSNGMTRDEIDASIRASIVQIAPWAVDMARSAEGKEPIANA